MSKVNYNKPPPWPKDYTATRQTMINANLNILDLNARPIHKDGTFLVTLKELESLVREIEDDECPEQMGDDTEARINGALSRLDLNDRPVHKDGTVTLVLSDLEYLVRQVMHDDWA